MIFTSLGPTFAGPIFASLLDASICLLTMLVYSVKLNE
jgi:hypothetical protein